MIELIRRLWQKAFGISPPLDIDHVTETVTVSVPTKVQEENIQNEAREDTFYPVLIYSENLVTKRSFTKNSDPYKGVLEKTFEIELKNRLDESLKVIPNAMIEINDATYELDFLIISSDKWYNVEIDEPYTFKDGSFRPIHFIGCKDQRRDEVFFDSGISIIRFAEMQIAKFQAECGQFVIDVIKNNNFPGFPKTVCRWTWEDSEVMIREKERDKYLPFSVNEYESTTNHYKAKCLLILEIRVVRLYEAKGKSYAKIMYSNDVIKETILEYDQFQSLLLKNHLLLRKLNNSVSKYNTFLINGVTLGIAYKGVVFKGYGSVNDHYLNISPEDLVKCELLIPDSIIENYNM